MSGCAVVVEGVTNQAASTLKGIPLLKWSALLSLTAAVVGGLLLVTMPAWSSNPAADGRAVIAAALVSAAISVAGVIAVARLARSGVGGHWAPALGLIGMPVRLLMAVLCMIVLVKLAELPVVSTVLAMMIEYVVLLVVETTLHYRSANAVVREPIA